MNTIKFCKKSDIRKETSNVEDYEINKLKINSKEYNYFSDAQISLYITKKCNANCKFCMNNLEKRCLNSIELTDKDYFNMLNKYLDFFKDIKPWITITGGEPTLSNRLIKTLEILKEKNYKIRTFSTNGTGLLKRVNNKPIIEYMLENNVINNVSISRMSIDDLENRNLMNSKNPLLSNEDLKKISLYSKTNSIEIRLSCLLLKNGVKDLTDMLEFITFYENLGINSIMFRELIPLPYTNDSKIDIKNIFKEIENSKDFISLREMDGLYYTVKVYSYKDYIVKCYQEKENVNQNIIREFVIYPDGKLDNNFDNETIMEVL